MRRIPMILGGLLLFGAGYILGTSEFSWTAAASAQNAPLGGQPDAGIQLAEETANKIPRRQIGSAGRNGRT